MAHKPLLSNSPDAPANAEPAPTSLAATACANLPLGELLLAMAEEHDSRRMRRVMHSLAERVAAGAPLEEAVRDIRHRLPGYFRHAIDVAKDQDQTISLLAGLARQEGTRRRLQRQLRSVLLYPAIVMALLSLVIIGAGVILVPQFEELFNDVGLTLPTGTIALIEASKLLPAIFLGAAAVAAAWMLMALIPGGLRIRHWLRTSLPVVGRVWTWSAQHEFACVLGALTGQRLPIVDALEYAAASLQDRNLARSTKIAARKCEAGAPLSQAMADSIHFDRALTALVSWGEANDRLPQALHQAATLFEEEIDLHTSFLRRVLPPLMFVIVLTTVFFMIMMLMVPLVSVINNLSG